MRILLINVPRWNELVGKNPSIIERHRGFNPPLGLLYLAACLKKTGGCEVEILDTQPSRLTYPQLEKQLQGKYYDIIGISLMTFTLIDAYKTAVLVKKIMPRTKVVLGGSHVHLFPDETIGLDGIDFAFMGEAEYPFLEFVKNFKNPDYFSRIPGLVYRDNDGLIKKNDFFPVEDLDGLPFPQRNMLNIKHYDSLLSKGVHATTIVSSRGCPFKCAFCDRPLSPITSRFRFRSAHNVVDEIEQCCSELGIRDFLFYDDTFTVNRARVFDICEEILTRRLKIRWDIRTRVDMVDEEMLKTLKNAGCIAVHYGVEAASDKILKIIKKNFTVKDVREVFTLTRKVGLETLAYFMIGLPQQDLNDIQQTFSLVKELRPEYAHFTIFSPYPGTELYSLGLEKGVIKKDVWREFARAPDEHFKIPLWEEIFSRQQLYEMIVRFYKSFYLRPSYILSRVIKVHSTYELVKKARAGLSVFSMNKEGVDRPYA